MKRQLPILLLAFLMGAMMSAQAQFSPQKAIVEKFTGSWCGYCPEGASILDDISNNESNAIPIAYHNRDAMANAQGDSVASFFGPAFPQAVFNRGGSPISRGSWTGAATSTVAGASSATVNFMELRFNPGSRIMTAKVEIGFTGYLQGDLRLGLMIIEDSVTGTGSGYDQTNYFNTTAGHQFQGRGNPIPNYVHRHVFREAIGSVWGNPGILPNEVNFGTRAEHTFEQLIPITYDVNQISLVAFVSQVSNSGTNVSDRKIINGEGVHMMSNLTNNTSIDGEADFASEVKVFPNPASDLVNFSFNLKSTDWVKAAVYDQQGRIVTQLAEGMMNTGTHSLRWDASQVSAGMYLIKISSAEEALTRRVIVR